MGQDRFITRQEPYWRELEALVRRARRRGVRSLSAEELSRLDRLYRLTTVHLAQVQSRMHNEHLLGYLNRLASSAHSIIYAPARRGSLRAAFHFAVTGFACAVARTGKYHALSLALLLLGIAGGYFIAHIEPDGAYMLLPAGEVRMPGASVEQLETVLRGGRSMESGEKALFSSFLFTHNTKVGFMACASGVLAGVFTVFLMLMNGALLGAFAFVHVSHGVGLEMASWIFPHGVTELLAVVLCGGGGLVLGAAVVAPGHQSRKAALSSAGRQVLLILLGIIPMFLFAGLTEGYLRQSHLSIAPRLWFAGGTFLFWSVYFARGLRLVQRERIEAKALQDEESGAEQNTP